MTVVEDQQFEVIADDSVVPSSLDLQLAESIELVERDVDAQVALVESYVEDDADRARLVEAVRQGRAIVLDLIRPCVGRGRGKHLYQGSMLEANASKFAGWKMYLNHLSDQARRALGGLPRDIRDTGGIVQESWWNPDVPAEGRFGKGAVQGVAKPVPLIQELHKVDPRLVECSINATATGVKPGRAGSEQVWVVEGIQEKGSVDWITEAGAGGRVAQIMEAMIEDGSALPGLLESMSTEALAAWVTENRPDLAEAMKADEKETSSDDSGNAELEAMVKDLLKSGKAKSRAQAVVLAKQALAKKNDTMEEGDLSNLSPEALTEALTSDTGKSVLGEIIGPAVVEAVKELNLGAEVASLIESRMEEDREVIHAEARAAADRRNELRDMRDAAHRIIEESTLHDELKTRVKGQFDLIEGVPTSSLNLVSDEDANGQVVKSARDKLSEAVASAIKDGLDLQAKLNPTRVRGQGVSLVEGEEQKDADGKPIPKDKVGPTTSALLGQGTNGLTPEQIAEAYELGNKLDRERTLMETG